MQSQVRARRQMLKMTSDGFGTVVSALRLLKINLFKRFGVCLVVPLCTVATGCSTAPSVAVLGAYFPDWLFCIVGAVVLVACLHVLFWRRGLGALLSPPAIVYPSLMVLFAAALWAVGFNL
jgi:hypothetical protein